MRWYSVPAVGLALLAAPGPGAGGAEPPGRSPDADVAAAARAVFAAKCAGCHGPDLPRPQGRFGYVLDLGKMAANPEMVVPFRPAESELWVLTDRGDMPPPDSPHGPLTAAEKDAVRAWIAVGAPAAYAPAPDPGAAPAPEPPTEPLSGPPPAWRALRWLGKFHLLLLHFPVALVLAAAAGEVVSLRRGERAASPAVRFCLTFAAITAVPTVALGWVHAAAGSGVGSPQLLAAHRWLGTAAGVWVVGTALWVGWEGRPRAGRRGVRIGLVFAAVLLVAAVAHLGGLMAHGNDFFDW
ncbi:MAG TPA: hypothetical protein VH092_29810 [Urbifossiella sp.]|jgi:mono/diheme cytochrome c family protein/uncharacterized membrane protein|nr:hypothetical protein [Urbifossiella sp.]